MMRCVPPKPSETLEIPDKPSTKLYKGVFLNGQVGHSDPESFKSRVGTGSSQAAEAALHLNAREGLGFRGFVAGAFKDRIRFCGILL